MARFEARHWRGAGLVAVALYATGCASEPVPSLDAPPLPAPPSRPADCRTVPQGAALQAAVDAASAGEALCLAPGRYDGPLTLDKAVTLWGPREASIRSSGKGTTVLVTGAGASLLGVTVDGSGGRFDVLDAAVKVHADDVTVRGVRVVNAVFGVLVEQARRVSVIGCEVKGSGDTVIGLRGDTIRLWEVRDSRIEGNLIEDGRDMVVWYSSGNQVRDNVVRNGRYGTHFMYSHDNTVEGNQYLGNVVGIFVMYSRNLTVRRNTLLDSSGAAGIGLGLKESGNVTVRQNLFVHNTVGVYLDTSPLQVDDSNLFEHNSFRLGEVAVVFHSSQKRNTFRRNGFRDNQSPVRVEGGGHALESAWVENDFDDYAGYDLDHDGFGDLPFELRSLTSSLAGKHPDLAFFHGTPAFALVDAVGEALPLFAPKPLLRDERPWTGRTPVEASDAR